MRLRFQSSAKINLTLDITGVLPNGYHTLRSIVHTVGLFDEIRADFVPNAPLQFSCSRADLAGEDNLCCKTVALWNRETGARVGGKIVLQKNIPTGAGLGGGSGNAAALLLALNKTRAKPLHFEQLLPLAVRLGADVPLFLRGGALLMEGIGEKLSALPPLSGWLLLVKPPVSLATPPVFHAFDARGFGSENGTDAMLATFEMGRQNPALLNVKTVAADLSNDLEAAAATISASPARLSQMLRNVGALGAQMSGSGSACFGLFESESAAKSAQKQLEIEVAKEVLTQGSRSFVVPFCAFGAREF